MAFVTLGTVVQNELKTPPSPPSSPRRRATDGNTENLEVFQVPTRAPRDAAPGCAAAQSVPCRRGRLTWSASKAMELTSRNMSPAPRPWTGTSSRRGRGDRSRPRPGAHGWLPRRVRPRSTPRRVCPTRCLAHPSPFNTSSLSSLSLSLVSGTHLCQKNK